MCLYCVTMSVVFGVFPFTVKFNCVSMIDCNYNTNMHSIPSTVTSSVIKLDLSVLTELNSRQLPTGCALFNL